MIAQGRLRTHKQRQMSLHISNSSHVSETIRKSDPQTHSKHKSNIRRIHNRKEKRRRLHSNQATENLQLHAQGFAGRLGDLISSSSSAHKNRKYSTPRILNRNRGTVYQSQSSHWEKNKGRRQRKKGKYKELPHTIPLAPSVTLKFSEGHRNGHERVNGTFHL